MRVYVHGNCQAPAIAQLIKLQFPNWDIASYEVFSEKIINEIDRYHYYVETSDIIISQPVHARYRDRDDLALGWVKEFAKRSAQFVIFPSMFFDGQLVGCRSIKIPAFGMPYHDALFLHLATAGVALPDIIRIISADDLYSDEFISNEISLSVAEMRRREQVDGIDVPISPFLTRYGTTTQLFHVINHPCRPALAYVASGVLAFLGYPADIAYNGQEYLRFPHIPCPPSVTRFMKARGDHPPGWQLEDPHLYHIPSERLSRSDYLARAYDHLGQFPKAELLSYMSDVHVRSFLNRLAVGLPWLPGIEKWKSTGISK